MNKPLGLMLAVLDDPQTDESARSPSQVQIRVALLNGAILNLAGPGEKISAIMPCTIIQPDDMADRILDREKCPAWQGEVMKFIYKWPDRMDLWETYTEMWKVDLRAGGTMSNATAFYRAHRKEMDKGCVEAWPERFNEDEISALQFAMNIRFRDEDSEDAFFAEFQSEPRDILSIEGATRITEAIVMNKVIPLARQVVPESVTKLTAMIDVHGEALYWLVCGWEDNYTGHIIDYGVYPEQPKGHFVLSALPKPMSSLNAPGTKGLEGRIYAGLKTLVGQLITKDWKTSDGSRLKIERCLIDANWGQSTDVVYRFIVVQN